MAVDLPSWDEKPRTCEIWECGWEEMACFKHCNVDKQADERVREQTDTEGVFFLYRPYKEKNWNREGATDRWLERSTDTWIELHRGNETNRQTDRQTETEIETERDNRNRNLEIYRAPLNYIQAHQLIHELCDESKGLSKG